MEAKEFKARYSPAQVPSCLLSGDSKVRHSLCRDFSLSCNSCPGKKAAPMPRRRLWPHSVTPQCVIKEDRSDASTSPGGSLVGAGGVSAVVL